jgi:hypothetical protein
VNESSLYRLSYSPPLSSASPTLIPASEPFPCTGTGESRPYSEEEDMCVPVRLAVSLVEPTQLVSGLFLKKGNLISNLEKYS